MFDRTNRIALGLVVLALAIALRPPARAQKAEVDGRRTEAALELDALKGRLDAKLAEVKLEEGRVELARMNKENAERYAALKFGSATYLQEATNAVLYAESKAVARRAEAEALRARYEEARRRPDEGEAAPDPADDAAERLALARRELDVLEGQMATKQAELKLEASRAALARTLQANAENNLRTHHNDTTPMSVQNVKVSALYAEARAAARQAEFAEATARYELARRRLASGRAADPAPVEERVGALERRLDELFRRVDAIEDRLIALQSAKK